MKRTKLRMWICIVLLCIVLIFIWGNSLMPAEISKAFSSFVRDLLSVFFGGIGGGEADFGEGILRKIAHFLEFACLGSLFCWLFSMLDKRRVLALACGFAAACVDETIQRFVPGRGPRFTDVLLDSAGVACGIAVLLLCVTIYKKRNNKIFGG